VSLRGHRLKTGDAVPRTVVFTADDFGLSCEVNAAVINTFRKGVITSTSLMVAGAGRDEAASLAHQYPALDVGLHVVVCRGFSILAAERLAGIVDRERRFSSYPVLAGLKYFFNRRLRTHLHDELRAQIDTHLKLVGHLHHLDGHLNFQVHPAIAAILLELAAEYGIPYIRLPREPLLTSLRLAHDHLPRKLAESMIFSTLSRRMFKLMQTRGIRTTDHLFGLHQTAHINEAYVAGLIAALPTGSTEIYFHPAKDIGGRPPPPAAQLEAEILVSPRVRTALVNSGVRLTSFADLAHEPAR
jgi:chitin disaccharide deacetylase